MVPEPGRRAVFLDRDGTIIEDVGYPSDPAAVRLLPGAAEGIRRLRDSGFAIVIVSNQSGVGRGLFSMADLERVHERTVELLAEEGAEIDGAFYCPHSPDDGCDCRKPATGLIDRARSELDLDADGCVFIGDKRSDVEAGSAAGCSTILFGDAEVGATEPSHRIAGWDEIAGLIPGAAR